jgi:hypothetical protein
VRKGLEGGQKWSLFLLCQRVDNGTLVSPTYLSKIVAFPFVDEGARLLEEPLFAGAPETSFEWFIAGRWCQLLSAFVAKTD